MSSASSTPVQVSGHPWKPQFWSNLIVPRTCLRGRYASEIDPAELLLHVLRASGLAQDAPALACGRRGLLPQRKNLAYLTRDIDSVSYCIYVQTPDMSQWVLLSADPVSPLGLRRRHGPRGGGSSPGVEGRSALLSNLRLVQGLVQMPRRDSRDQLMRARLVLAAQVVGRSYALGFSPCVRSSPGREVLFWPCCRGSVLRRRVQFGCESRDGREAMLPWVKLAVAAPSIPRVTRRTHLRHIMRLDPGLTWLR